MSDTANELIKMTATEAVDRLRSKEVSPLDLVDASIQRIETALSDKTRLRRAGWSRSLSV